MARIEMSLFLAPSEGMQPRMLRAAVTPPAPARRWSKKQLAEISVRDPRAHLQHQNHGVGEHSLAREERRSAGRDVAFSEGKVAAPGGSFASGTPGLALLPSCCWCRATSAPSLQGAVTCCSGMPRDPEPGGAQCQDAKIWRCPVPEFQGLVLPRARLQWYPVPGWPERGSRDIPAGL